MALQLYSLQHFGALDGCYPEIPFIFKVVSLLGGTYLLYLAYQLFRQTPEAMKARNLENTSPMALAILGYITAVSNPKGWAFLIALLPGFVASDGALFPQFLIMMGIMLTTEFISMTVYATGGQESVGKQSS